ncbi:hypothetical protein MF672_016750 [Actinomadura sp. ATCC 31491]|uniref:MFS transporter n=1 Tax=Actinomadura luzonensis TaxID=2805427 RepID=A0ABT0FSV3_9ACTN|nr:hypothetical protein [Actinomadura luzonensis]MCK2215426.1 hypothetical protein [Actinomadura luzonensis]
MLRAVARHRFGRAAAVAVALYLTAVAVAMALGGGRALVGLAPITPVVWWDAGLWPLYAAVCVLDGWSLWQILRGPALPRAGAPGRAVVRPGEVVWLRRLLYADVAGELVLWELLDDLSEHVAYAAGLAVSAATVVLLVRVLSGVTARFRVVAVALGLAGLLAGVLRLFATGTTLTALFWAGLAAVGCRAMILAGQHHDGRFSPATTSIGWIALLASQAGGPLLDLGRPWSGGLEVAVHALGGLGVVWQARTAHELAAQSHAADGAGADGAGADGSAARLGGGGVAVAGGGRVPRGLVAAVLALPLAVVGAEEGVRLTYTAPDDGCRDRLRPAAGLGVEERRRSFLCLARGETFTTAPLFPEDLPDQRVLARGEELCALPGDRERDARHRRAGGSGDTAELAAALDHLCPGLEARRQADAARRQAERDREVAEWKAAANARCADPWPRTRARRQGTAAYMLFEGGGYAVFDDREEFAADPFAAVDDGFIDVAGSSAAILTGSENTAMCLTVKAFDAAPPLRLTGWDRVVEVGITSRSGRLVVPPYPEGGGSGAAGPLPNLAVAGPGHYRLRVHARTRPWDADDPDAPLEEHLVVVYPGRSAKKAVHRVR